MNAKAQAKKKPEPTSDHELMILVDDAVQDTPAEGAPEWALTFGDMMSLLLCFFILMFSMSEIKLDKFMQAAESMRAGFGQSESPTQEVQGQGSPTMEATTLIISKDEIDQQLDLIRAKLEEFVKKHGLENTLKVNQDENGVTLSIQDVVLFDVASAEIRAASLWIMDKLSELVTEINTKLIVIGHTDNLPINTVEFPSNWELSAARAARVTRVLVDKGIDPARIHVEGYAEYKPIADNNTWEGRAANRRVELLYSRQNVREKMGVQPEEGINE